MKPRNWIPMLGECTIDGDTLIFKGGTATVQEKSAGYQIGNFINNLEFGGGNLSATIRFHEDTVNSGAGLMLYYSPSTSFFIEAQ